MALRLLQLVLLLGVALSAISAHPPRHSTRHVPSKHGLESEQTSPTSLKVVEEKLDLILDSEIREKKLIEGFLLYDNTPPKSGKIEQIREEGKDEEGEEGEEDGENNQETSVITTSAQESANTPRHPKRNAINGKEIKEQVESVKEKKVEEGFVNNERKLDKREKQELSLEGPTTSETQEDQGEEGYPASSYSNPDVLVKKLEENSKRMETMVVFLADLRNVLSEAVGAQEKQVALTGEVIQLKEEIEYLREEMEKLREEKTESRDGGKLDNKVKNDERTIEWLKTSVSELRHGLEEVSSSVNVTGLLHLRQQWSGEVSRVDGDLRELRKDVEALKGSGARNEEALVEIKGDIADLRTWHLKMGQKFSQQEEQESGQISQEQPSQSLSTTSEGKENKEWRMRKVSQKKLTSSLLQSSRPYYESDSPATATTKETGNESIHKNRHSKNRLRSDLKSLALVIHDVVRDQDILHKRFVKLDKKIHEEMIAQAERYAGALRRGRHEESYSSRGKEWEQAGSGEGDNNVIRENSGRQGADEEGMTSGVKNRDWRRHHHGESTPTQHTFTQMRINSLERNMAQYGNTLQHVSDKVASLSHLQESSTQLFTALEALETKYDQRLTDMQTGLARLEATVSTTSIINDEIKAQQSLHSKEYAKLNKDFIGTRGQVETNHLRLAAVQSQMLRWGIKSCTDTDNESIQNIKIASLEAKLR